MPRAVVSKLETQESLWSSSSLSPKAGEDWHPISKTVWQRQPFSIILPFCMMTGTKELRDGQLDGYLQLWCGHQVWQQWWQWRKSWWVLWLNIPWSHSSIRVPWFSYFWLACTTFVQNTLSFPLENSICSSTVDDTFSKEHVLTFPI